MDERALEIMSAQRARRLASACPDCGALDWQTHVIPWEFTNIEHTSHGPITTYFYERVFRICATCGRVEQRVKGGEWEVWE